MKIVKGNKTYNTITGDDVIVTRGTNCLKTVDEALDDQQKEIDKLKSNVKYMYSYGGVGGNGSGGGSGSGSSSGQAASLFISLAGHQLQNEGNAIILGETGTYYVEGNVRNSNGEIFFLKVACGTDIEYVSATKLSTELNLCKYKKDFTLNTNGEIVVQFFDADYNPIETIRQRYIVKSHTFDAKFMYKFNNGASESEFSSSNEYFIGDVNKTNPFIDASFKIDIPNITNVSLKYSIGDTDSSDDEEKNGQGVKSYGSVTDITNNHFRIYLDKLTRGGVKFTNDANTGVYTVSMTLEYYSSGEIVESKLSFEITLIPGAMYVNVRNPQGVVYDTLEDLMDAMDNGVNGIPAKYVTAGSYVSFYCKVYEGNMTTNTQSYDLTFSAYDDTDDSDDEYIFETSPSMTETLTGVVEQVETPKPISVPFSVPGVKKLEFSTYTKKDSTSVKKIFTKYLFVKPAESTVDWYPEITMSNYYFRANQGNDSYSDGFPQLSSGTQPLEFTVSSSPMTLADPEWRKSSGEAITATILSIGIQYSSVNEDHSKILDVYAPYGSSGYSDTPDISLYSDQLFSETSDQKVIRIPYDDNYDKTENSQYHLIQIVKYKVGYINTSTPQYASYLYIDGIVESNKPTLDSYAWYIGKIVLNNVNASYNLINIQNIRTDNINLDGLIYQYNLKYRESMKGETLGDADMVMLANIDNIKFDGTNVVVNKTAVETIAPKMPISSMLISYRPDDADKFKEALFQGYSNGDNGSFGQRIVDLYWCDGTKYGNVSKLHQVSIPQIGSLIGSWLIELQGTSTMRNRIKNFSLILQTQNSGGDSNEKLLMSPNYKSNDPSTFLPEQIWTIKADIADSAHANNTSIGKFVNRVCTKYGTGESYSSDTSKYIKNTLEGFPVMMYFQIGEEVYYLGVYNFNMGRNSYYNLGYNTAKDTQNMINTITSSTDDDEFCFAVGVGETVTNLAIGEIQDNFAQFDFHQYDDSVLFQDDTSSITKMFGKDSKITGASKSAAKQTLSNFVKSVARAGAYCFANIGKTPVSSQADNGTDCVDRYTVVNQVPDIAYQLKYEGTDMIWSAPDSNSITFESVKNNVDNLLQCFSDNLMGEVANTPLLDYTSASEYYTICMAFGLVDSVLKNMNIKSWNGKKCYIAFYDMDCANGENNAGGEDVSYLAATDYWHSKTDKGFVEPVTVDWDYWDETVGKGFDFKSSYLFAIVKYAQALLNSIDDTKNIKLSHYPQEFWAILRNPDTGELRNVDYFINNYFISGIGQIPTYMASLNYQVKYLYKGSILDDNGKPTDDKFLANNTAFNGSRIVKVKDWLTKRFHFLDAMFNVQGIGIKISSGVFVPVPTNYLNGLSSNPDITILTDAFTTDKESRVLSGNNALAVNVYAPLNTPFVINRGSSYDMYLLCAGTGVANPIQVTTQRDVATRFLGSKSFTKLSMVEPFLTSAYQIVSNNIEEIIYGGTTMPQKDVELSIVSTSAKVVKMNIPTFSGTLKIDTSGLNGQAIHTLDVSNSGFCGTWSGLKNLQNLNISNVYSKTGKIYISNCPLLKGNNCNISGRSSDNRTTIDTLDISGVSGDFRLTNTAIQYINISSLNNEDSTFEISGDNSLTSLTLTGFKKVVVKDCPKLETLIITDTETNKCEGIEIKCPWSFNDIGKETYNPLLTSFNSTLANVYDFSTYENLQTLSVSGCHKVERIKMPDHKVKVGTFQNNVDLEFIDTIGKDSVIALTGGSTFYMCPRYGMRQSWSYGSSDTWFNNKPISETADNDNAYTNLTYTKMCIDDGCTTLERTFNKSQSIDSRYLKNNGAVYVNEWGQKLNNSGITATDAQWFVNTVVAGGGLNDAYLKKMDDDGDEVYYIIVDTSNTIVYGNDCRANITSFEGCFSNQKGIHYVGTGTIPDLSGYTNLVNVSKMYYLTNVKFISSALLSLPNELNNNDAPTVNWSEFIGNGDVNISHDALMNVSYRTTEISSLSFSVYGNGSDYKNQLALTKDDEIKMVELLYPKYTSDGGDGLEIVPFERLTAFSAFSINSEQYVDYTGLFDACPNVTSLGGFLNCDLHRAKIDGILKPCTKLTYLNDSFNHNGQDVATLPEIDLYEFFNWGENTGMTCLFSSGTSETPGFALNKTVSFENFKKIIGVLHQYGNLRALASIFSYCTITDYDKDYEIVLSADMNNISSINSLFYKCKAVKDGLEVPLKIRRSFFQHLSHVVSMANTFNSVVFDHMFSYDFFCKRKSYTTDTNIYVYDEDNEKYCSGARLKTSIYGDDAYKITNMSNCFNNVKFKNCASWFYMDDSVNDGLLPEKSVVTYNNDSTYTKYYMASGGKYVEYEITEPETITDNRNNFTNYVSSIRIASKENAVINNHDIIADMRHFGNDGVVGAGVVLDTDNIAKFNIAPTYCCLPPDILYACSDDCKLTNVFANTNIVGVLPAHLVSKCYNAIFENMLLNTNILPNVFYHYDSAIENDSEKLAEYLDMIKDVPVDNDTVMDVDDSSREYVFGESENAVVLFRDDNGVLKRRRARIYDIGDSDALITDADYSKSQFVYVPQGYTTNNNLYSAFTFRYNLPNQVDLTVEGLDRLGIVWPDSGNSFNQYGNNETNWKDYSPEVSPDLWPAYTQYFFLADDSIDWKRLRIMRYPFIADGNDVDFRNGLTRTFSNSSQEGEYNSWWKRGESISRGTWHTYTNGVFNVFLNLCGKRDSRTGELTDCGCLISKSMDNYPKIDNFISGNLITFLNGRVFDDQIDGGLFTSNNVVGGKIINFNGFGRNIILPNFNSYNSKVTSAVLLGCNSQSSRFYKFMFTSYNTTNSYKSVYLGTNSEGYSEENMIYLGPSSSETTDLTTTKYIIK